MSRAALVMIGMVVGSIIGSYLPTLFGAGLFSFAAIIGNAIGGLTGIWISYKLTANL